MIVATRLSAVWQVAGVAAAALCCYLVSQSVAAERAGLLKVDRQIMQTHDDIAKLQTEIGVRGRMGQLERWNTQVLALQAPRPGQFVSDGVQLASLYGRKGQPALRLDPAIAGPQGSLTHVAYAQPGTPQAQTVPRPQAQPIVTPPAIEDASAQPMLRTATFVRAMPDRLAPGGQAGPGTASLIVKANYQLRPLAALKPASTAVKIAFHAPKSLLPEDIGFLAAREAKGSKDSSKAAR